MECTGVDRSYPDLVSFYTTWPYLYSWASAALIDFPAGAALAMGHAVLMISLHFPAVINRGDPCAVLTGRKAYSRTSQTGPVDSKAECQGRIS